MLGLKKSAQFLGQVITVDRLKPTCDRAEKRDAYVSSAESSTHLQGVKFKCCKSFLVCSLIELE